MRVPRFVAVALTAAVLGWNPAVAEEEVVLKAVSSWTPGTAFSRAFERFVEFVNAEGKGIIRINYIGGGKKIMSFFEMGNALKTGVFDILNTNSGYYTNLMPEAVAIKLTRKPMAELRQNGTWDYLERLLNEKVNAHLLARGKGDVPFHIFLRKGGKKPTAPDLSGLRLRSTANYRAFFIALGATPIRMDYGEMYTAMERGVVDGFGLPIQGLHEVGLVPVTAYRIDPGFFTAPNEILINLDVWKKLTDPQKAVLEFGSKWIEAWLPMYEDQLNELNKKIQAEAGVEVIEFKGEDAKKYLDKAYNAAWAEVLEHNKEHGPKLKELMER